MFITFFISGNDVISLESRPLNFRVFIHAYEPATADVFPVVAYRSKYPEEYLTVDKIGCEKPLASKSCFV